MDQRQAREAVDRLREMSVKAGSHEMHDLCGAVAEVLGYLVERAPKGFATCDGRRGSTPAEAMAARPFVATDTTTVLMPPDGPWDKDKEQVDNAVINAAVTHATYSRIPSPKPPTEGERVAAEHVRIYDGDQSDRQMVQIFGFFLRHDGLDNETLCDAIRRNVAALVDSVIAKEREGRPKFTMAEPVEIIRQAAKASRDREWSAALNLPQNVTWTPERGAEEIKATRRQAAHDIAVDIETRVWNTINEARAAAVVVEREACAKIAERVAQDAAKGKAKATSWSLRRQGIIRDTAALIAKAIRGR